MSLTLGEKLRQAREDKGFSLSEVADQTRISSLYLESIENDDYKILPGGIFNKGFVKSYAKFVGVDEQEALADYSRLVAGSSNSDDQELKVYRPEVLTDDRSGASMAPTVIIAVIILALMTGGILFLVNYLRQPAAPVAANNAPKPNANASNDLPANTQSQPSNIPDMATLKVEFKALAQPVKVIATVDGQPPQPNNVSAGSSATFTPKESLTLNYIRWNASNVEMTINGKAITLPQAPLEAKDRDRIVFTISKDNLAQIWTSGSVSGEAPATPSPDANPNTPASTPAGTPAATVTNAAPTPIRTPVPKPSIPANTITAPKPTPAIKVNPTPKSTVIVVPSANRPN